ncbi:hypothetical protein [Rhodopila sp.]
MWSTCQCPRHQPRAAGSVGGALAYTGSFDALLLVTDLWRWW